MVLTSVLNIPRSGEETFDSGKTETRGSLRASHRGRVDRNVARSGRSVPINPHGGSEEDRPDVDQESKSSHTPRCIDTKVTKQPGTVHARIREVVYFTVITTSKADCPASRSIIDADRSMGSYPPSTVRNRILGHHRRQRYTGSHTASDHHHRHLPRLDHIDKQPTVLLRHHATMSCSLMLRRPHPRGSGQRLQRHRRYRHDRHPPVNRTRTYVQTDGESRRRHRHKRWTGIQCRETTELNWGFGVGSADVRLCGCRT